MQICEGCYGRNSRPECFVVQTWCRYVNGVRSWLLFVCCGGNALHTQSTTFTVLSTTLGRSNTTSLLGRAKRNDRTLAEIVRFDHPTDEEVMELPFDPSEIYRTIHSGGRNRAPGRDVFGIEFYKATWANIRDDICLTLNHMFFGRAITPSRSAGQSYAYPNRIKRPRLPTTAK